jgi:hypothetical protein
MTRARDLAAFVSNADGDIKFDTDTLFIDSSANRVGIGTTTPSAPLDVELGTTGTIAEFRGDSTDLLNIDGDSNAITLDARNVASLNFEMQGTEAMRIDSSRNVGIGTSSPISALDLSGGADGTPQTITLAQGNASSKAAAIVGVYGDTNSQGIRFLTNSFGQAERMRILPAGGLTFNGDTAAANALNDYETGTWSPQYRCTSVDPTITYHTQVGIYTKIGDFVHCQGRIRTASVSGGSGSIELSNLPFTSNSTANSFSTLNIAYSNNWDADHFPHTGYVNANNTTIRLIIFNQSDPRDGFTLNPNQTDFSTGSSDNDLLFSVQYMTN